MYIHEFFGRFTKGVIIVNQSYLIDVIGRSVPFKTLRTSNDPITLRPWLTQKYSDRCKYKQTPRIPYSHKAIAK